MRASVQQHRAQHPDLTTSRTAVPALGRASNRMSMVHSGTDLARSRSNQAVQRWLRTGMGAPATMIGAAVASPASEAHEQAADRGAARVMRMPADRMLARQMDPRDFVGSQPVPAGDEEAVGPRAVHRQSLGPSSAQAMSADLGPSIDRAGGSGGRPLPAGTRQFMERRFGGDFSGVRIHTDRAAGDLADQLQARAFTTGHRIFFAPGEFQPDHASGRYLLAHELAHVIQQREGPRGAARAIQFKKTTGCQACAPYCSYDRSVDLESYNCSGLSRRTYDYPDLTAAKRAIARGDKIPCADPCSRVGMVKHWFWEYDSHLEDSKGTKIALDPDFHTVSGPTAGDPKPQDSNEVYSKDGQRKVHGPGTGPSFKPPARAQATSNDPSEKPGTDSGGKPLIKVCSVTAESCHCLPCPPAPAPQEKRTRP